MQILEMSYADLEQVSALGSQLGYPFSLEQISTRFQSISKLPTHKLFVAKWAFKVVGWIQINIESPSLLSDSHAEVSALIVDEKCRGQGIGKVLMKAGEAWVKEQNIKMIRIRSNVMREKAHLFYQHIGYSIKKSWHLLVKNF